ncbi:MAG: hypothetical protein A3I14_00275 [Candidatus Rokubacteria bacterium RIFCSPLOWO2_02_FULL_73_56]|nr:MAG: hypothetical protein A3I14_00275 [Candidatus Rokubacteria bacterium RIFCSPLOWO2_02_FULL_73_56]OGL28200.1 MAG: hypothetical protein A3G44_17890 [Candidatus Rokubacteria bacterium RIFCSPLOWO2_12_FULL_73_47]
MRALIVVNPIAGRGRGRDTGHAVAAALGRHGVAAELHLAGARGDTRARVAAAEGVDVVVVVGGDGTVREVLEALPPGDVAVAVVPAGTANVLARDLGLPADAAGAAEVILRGRSVGLDTARVDGRLCFLAASVGVDALAVREVARRRRGPITWGTWAAALARTLRRYRPPRLAVELDGAALPGAFGLVIVANCVRYAGVLRLGSDRRLDDGLFEVYLLRAAGRARLIAAVARGLLGALPGGGCERRRARRVRVTSADPAPYQVDGDAGGETPMTLEVGGRRYRLLVP